MNESSVTQPKNSFSAKRAVWGKKKKKKSSPRVLVACKYLPTRFDFASAKGRRGQ